MLQIKKLRADHTIDFAAEELKKYLRMMMPERGEIAISYEPEAKDGFRLGLLGDFSLPCETDDPKDDDIVHVDAGEDGGVLAGSNPRSVLYAVYRFLRLNGCRWLFPGVDGEFIPHKPVTAQKYHHMADTRFRGHTTEGYPSAQHILDYIDFFAKQELNSYGLHRIFTYHFRYYNHVFNEANRAPEPVSYELIDQWKGLFLSELTKRGIRLTDGEHEFIPLSYGLDPADRDLYKTGKKKIPEEIRPYLAMLNGKRDLNKNDPFFTQPCLSNKEWRARYVKQLADFAERRPELSSVGASLADGHHNMCECPECQKGNPSDFLVMLLNELDEEFTRRGIKTKISFSTYVDKMFPPLHEKIKNQSRFSISMPPITRTYNKGVDENTVYPPIKPYVRNKWEAPKTYAECISYLKAWQKDFHGPATTFEYHFWLAQCRDPGLEDISRRIYEDIYAMKFIGLSGITEDGSNRHYFPHGFHCHIYAETLVHRDLDYEAEAEDYFSHFYGEDWKAVRRYLRAVSDAFGKDYMAGQESADPARGSHYNPERAKKLGEVKELAAQARALAAQHMEMPTRPQTVAYRMLARHAEFCEGLAEVFIEKALGHNAQARDLNAAFFADFGKYEIELDRYMDFGLVANSISRIMRTDSMKAIEF